MPDQPALKPLTRLQTIEIMKVETRNEITRCEIMKELMNKQILRGVQGLSQVYSINQSKITSLEGSLKDLEDMHREELADKAKSDMLPK